MGRLDQLRWQKLTCSARTHGNISESGQFISMRCTDDHCPDVAYAKDHGLIAIHVWDLWSEERTRTTEFIPNLRARSGRMGTNNRTSSANATRRQAPRSPTE